MYLFVCYEFDFEMWGDVSGKRVNSLGCCWGWFEGWCK